MSASLVGSEMCIRDSRSTAGRMAAFRGRVLGPNFAPLRRPAAVSIVSRGCLLYTSDAADDM
eukprot:15383035-Alexandrium_andersonii.AAC.1